MLVETTIQSYVLIDEQNIAVFEGSYDELEKIRKWLPNVTMAERTVTTVIQ